MKCKLQTYFGVFAQAHAGALSAQNVLGNELGVFLETLSEFFVNNDGFDFKKQRIMTSITR